MTDDCLLHGQKAQHQRVEQASLFPQSSPLQQFQGLVQLNNCSFWGPTHQCVRQEGKGVVSLNQCHFQQWGHKGDEEAPAVETISGELTVTDCLFGMDRPQIRVGPEAGNAIINNNRYRDEKRVELLNDNEKKKSRFAVD